jgi:hypothetical protein
MASLSEPHTNPVTILQTVNSVLVKLSNNIWRLSPNLIPDLSTCIDNIKCDIVRNETLFSL